MQNKASLPTQIYFPDENYILEFSNQLYGHASEAESSENIRQSITQFKNIIRVAEQNGPNMTESLTRESSTTTSRAASSQSGEDYYYTTSDEEGHMPLSNSYTSYMDISRETVCILLVIVTFYLICITLPLSC